MVQTEPFSRQNLVFELIVLAIQPEESFYVSCKSIRNAMILGKKKTLEGSISGEGPAQSKVSLILYRGYTDILT